MLSNKKSANNAASTKTAVDRKLAGVSYRDQGMSQHYPYGLSKKELELSDIASKELGTKVLMYCDGQWICQAFDFKYKLGFGNTPVHATHNFREENDLET